MSTAGTPEERRGPGRPRKWASEADRVRAYRQRRADEQADLNALRTERRVLRRQLVDARRGRARAESAQHRAEAKAASLAAEVDRLAAQLEASQATVARLQQTLDARSPRDGEPTTAQPGPDPGRGNRSQRRAEQRRQKRPK